MVTLYYSGEMTAKEIGKFLGVSVNTIKSRLRRAESVYKSQNSRFREVLTSVALPSNLTENIMRQVADINPIARRLASP